MNPVTFRSRVRLAVDDGGIATVSLSRPEKHNGVDFPMIRRCWTRPATCGEVLVSGR